MSDWQLNPEGIQKVLTAVYNEAQTFSTDLSGTPEQPVNHGEVITNGLTWGIKSDGISLTAPVLNAVCAALEAQYESVKSIMNRINAGVLGVTNATLAYNQGNEDMAATFQNEAALAAQTGDFSYFENNGA